MSAKTAPVRLDVLGSVVEVRMRTPELDDRLRSVWEWSLADPDDEREPVGFLDFDAELPDSWLLQMATQTATIAGIEAQAGQKLMLHAAAVADTAGRTALFVGPSGMGKTTLAALLGRRWGYVTDECAAVDGSGQVARFTKPLAIGPNTDIKELRSPTEAGLLPPLERLQVDSVWLLAREPYVSLETVELRSAPAVAMLAEHTSYLSAMTAPLHRIADLVAQVGTVRMVRYGEASAIEQMLADWWSQ